MEDLFRLFDAIRPLSPELKTYLLSMLISMEFKRKDIILQSGQTANRIYFIEKGLVRSVRFEKGRERTAWFMKEGDVMLSVESFFNQTPSLETIEALEDCLFHSISREQLYMAYERYPEFNLHRAVILEKYYPQSEARARMRQLNASEKFEHLMNTQPDLVTRVTDKMLASFLGVTPGTYSYQKGIFANRDRKRL